MNEKTTTLEETLIMALEYIERNCFQSNSHEDECCSGCWVEADYKLEGHIHIPVVENHKEDCQYVAVTKELREKLAYLYPAKEEMDKVVQLMKSTPVADDENLCPVCKSRDVVVTREESTAHTEISVNTFCNDCNNSGWEFQQREPIS